MKTLYTYILLLFCGEAYSTALPPNQYELAWVEGEFWYQPSGQVKWQKVEKIVAKTLLNATDKIKIGQKSQVILTANDGGGYLLNKVGVWRLQQLVEQPQPQNASMVRQYLGFLMKHLTHSEKSIDDYAEGYMRKKGLVNRGHGQTPPLMLLPQYESAIAGVSVVFAWKSQKDVSVYELSLYDDWNETSSPIWQQETTDTTLKIDLDKALIERDRDYYWNVAAKNQTTGIRYSFKRIKNEDLKQFEQKLNDMTLALQYSQAMNAFVKAGLYEENLFYPEANRAFQQALQIEPTNKLFRQSYALFLARNGQIEEAKHYQMSN